MPISHRTEGQNAHPAEGSIQPQGAMHSIALSGGAGDLASLVSRPRPRITTDTDVLVQVQAAGLCRTDLYVANGDLPASPGVILGHEGSGIVRELGRSAAAAGLEMDAFVGIDPRVPCGHCAGCQQAGRGASPSPDRCLAPHQLGIDLDGVFAEYVAVPVACLVPIEAEICPLRAAYLEPVAAAMGALTAGLTPEDTGVVAGQGRIAELTARVLEYSGFPRPQVVPTEAFDASLPLGTLDFVIDAGLPTDGALAAMTGALRKGGNLVLKSRAAQARSFMPADWVAREITVAARSYGSFHDAARAIGDERLVLEDLFGTARPLSAFEHVFDDARAAESVKQFFDVSGSAVSGARRTH